MNSSNTTKPFLKDIRLKKNLIPRLEFELTYGEAAVQHF